MSNADPTLTISYPSGEQSQIALSKQQPISIGRHQSNDLVIDDADVASLHCRVSWNRTHYEIVAASGKPFEINGRSEREAELNSGDVLRIGPVEVMFFDPNDQTVRKKAAREPVAEESAGVPAVEHTKPAPAPDSDEAAHDGAASDEAAYDEAAPSDSMLSWSELDAPEEEERAVPAEEPTTLSPRDRLRARMRGSDRRPGERDPARSPLVLTLGGAAAALILLGLVFWFILGRQSAQALYESGRQNLQQGRFAQGISQLSDFLILYPDSNLADEVSRELGLARVDQVTAGGAPDWSKALDRLQGFITERRDREDFAADHNDIWTRAAQIAAGAAEAAGERIDRELLQTSDQARLLMNRFQPEDVPFEQTVRKIERAKRVSEAAILKQETIDSALAEIDRLLQDKQPLAVLDVRRTLIERYPDVADSKAVRKALQDALDVERSLVDRPEPAEQSESAASSTIGGQSAALVFRARTRTSDVSVGEQVLVVSRGTLWSIDTVTGTPQWQRYVGEPQPFFPVTLGGSRDDILVYDTTEQSLLRLQRADGAVVWNRPLKEFPTGAPQRIGNSVYLATEDRTLGRFNLATGEQTAAVQFSQPAAGQPAVIAENERLIVPGRSEVVYTLTSRPLEAISVSYLGHATDSIIAPPTAMGPYVLIIENLAGERGRLHLLDATSNSGTLTPVATSTITGWVTDPPVIRGRDLYIASSTGAVSTFFISDSEGQPPLAAGPTFQATEQAEAVYLHADADRRLWLAGGGLRELQLTADALQPDGPTIAPGRSTQPLQVFGPHLFFARQVPWSEAVRLTRMDRQDRTAGWQTIVDAEILALSISGNTVLAATDSGRTFRLSLSEIADESFLYRTQDTFEPPAELSARTLADGRIAVWHNGPSDSDSEVRPELRLISPTSAAANVIPLSRPLAAPPALWGSRLVLPLSDRLQVLHAGEVAPFRLPLGQDDPPSWVDVRSIDDERLLAITTDGAVRLLIIEQDPAPFLAEQAAVPLGEAVTRDGVIAGDVYVTVDATGRLHGISLTGFEPVASLDLEREVISPLFGSNDHVLLQTSDLRLRCVKAGDDLQPTWSIPLDSPLAGTGILLEGDRWVIPLTDGKLLWCESETGEVVRTESFDRPLQGDVLPVEERLIVPAAGGSLWSPPAMESGD